jgi:hypothetical protein
MYIRHKQLINYMIKNKIEKLIEDEGLCTDWKLVENILENKI